MTTQKVSTFTHASNSYSLKVGGWNKFRDSDLSEALFAVHTDDIQLMDGISVAEYKSDMRLRYESIERGQYSSIKSFFYSGLPTQYQKSLGQNWDECIATLKDRINQSCVQLLLDSDVRQLSIPEQKMIHLAACNGHVFASQWIGRKLSHKNDSDCLFWLSMAHNRGALHATYEMAEFLARQDNYVDSLRCLIISADSGNDIAYMSIFNSENLRAFLDEKALDRLDEMLKSLLVASNASCARYFQIISSIVRGDKLSRIKQLLHDFSEKPKRPIRRGEDKDESYLGQFEFAQKLALSILKNIENGSSPLEALVSQSQGSTSVGFKDYNEILDHFHKMASEC